MERLIDADAITDSEIIDYLGIRYASCFPDVRDMLNDQPTIEAVQVDRNRIIDEFAQKAIERLEDMGCEAWRRDIMAIAEEMKGVRNE